MRTRFGLRHLIAVLGLTAAALPPVILADAPAAHAAVCSPGSGVSVVVDFGQLGGAKSGCAAGSPSTGLKALTGAGFGYRTNTSGMICRIDSLPDSCPGTPPVDAYWSYWIADRGGDWAYSSKGAGNRTPPVGSVEGWAFGAGKPPAQAPPAKGSTGGGGGSDDGGDSGGSSGGGSDDGGDGGSRKSGEPDPSESGKKKTDKESSAAAGQSGAADGSGDGGAAESEGTGADYDNASSVGPQMGTVGGIFGAAVVAVLAAAVGWRVWQRRREAGRTPAEAPPEPAE